MFSYKGVGSQLVPRGIKCRKTENQSCGKLGCPFHEENTILAILLQSCTILLKPVLYYNQICLSGRGQADKPENKSLSMRDDKSPSSRGHTAELSEMGHWDRQQSKFRAFPLETRVSQLWQTSPEKTISHEFQQS